MSKISIILPKKTSRIIDEHFKNAVISYNKQKDIYLKKCWLENNLIPI